METDYALSNIFAKAEGNIMSKLLITPKPESYGGPSLAMRRMLPYLLARDFQITNSLITRWDVALVNILGGKQGVGVIASNKPFLYRSAGYYVPEIFDRTGRPWNWRYDIANMLVKLFLKKANWIVFQSQFAKSMLSSAFNFKRDNFSIIHNGVDLNQFRPVAAKKKDTITVGVIGKMRHERVKTLIQISSKLSLPHNLLVVGAINDMDKLILQQYAQQNNVAVLVTGPVALNILPEMYNKVDIFVHSAASDWCPNAVVEALACGVPVVCHAYGGTAELVGKGGICVPGSPFHLEEEFISKVADSIIHIQENLGQYRDQARGRAEEALNICDTSSRYAEILTSIAH